LLAGRVKGKLEGMLIAKERGDWVMKIVGGILLRSCLHGEDARVGPPGGRKQGGVKGEGKSDKWNGWPPQRGPTRHIRSQGERCR